MVANRGEGALTLCSMAIVKVTYTKEKAAAKQTVRYIAHRPGKDTAKVARVLFGNDGVMGRQLAYRMIDAAAHDTFFYRAVPQPRRPCCSEPRGMQQSHSTRGNRRGTRGNARGAGCYAVRSCRCRVE